MKQFILNIYYHILNIWLKRLSKQQQINIINQAIANLILESDKFICISVRTAITKALPKVTSFIINNYNSSSTTFFLNYIPLLKETIKNHMKTSSIYITPNDNLDYIKNVTINYKVGFINYVLKQNIVHSSINTDIRVAYENYTTVIYDDRLLYRVKLLLEVRDKLSNKRR